MIRCYQNMYIRYCVKELFLGSSIYSHCVYHDRNYNNEEGLHIHCSFWSLSVYLYFYNSDYTPLTIRQLKENNKRLLNGKDYEAIIQFGDNIKINQGTFSLTIEYNQILKIHELKHSYVLMFAKSSGIILDPAGFTIGDFSTFKEFIGSC